MMNYFGSMMGGWGGDWFPFAGMGMVLSLALIAWSLYWKGMALWKAAHKENVRWFIALLIFNTVGILDILYIYVFSKDKEKVETPEQK